MWYITVYVILGLSIKSEGGVSMAKKNDTGVFQLDNGNWAYRIYMSKDANGNKVDTTCRKDEQGNVFKTKKSAVDARTK